MNVNYLVIYVVLFGLIPSGIEKNHTYIKQYITIILIYITIYIKTHRL